MNILFLGSVYPADRIEEIKRNSSFFDYPGNTFQNALIDGFDSHVSLNVIAAPAIKKYKSLFFKSSTFTHNGKTQDVCLSEIDIPAVKELVLAKSFHQAVKKITGIDAIIIYSTSFPALYAAYRYKRINKKVKILNLITDLPQDMSHHNSRVYDSFKKIGIKLYYKYTKYIDGYILLSSKMPERLPIGKTPWIQIEGIYNDNIKIGNISKAKDKLIVYTGALSCRYGIVDLLDAFSMIKGDSYRLCLCGRGDAVNIIKERQRGDSRIKYLGVLNRAEVLCLQKEATLLINPRNSKEDYTKYSFPSKTMEYMASGTPTLMTRLQCLPEEYDQYLFFIEDESPVGIKEKIVEICSMPQSDLDKLGNNAANFILSQKNAVMQTKKIIQFINELSK